MRVTEQEAIERGWIAAPRRAARAARAASGAAGREDAEQCALIAWFDARFPALSGRLYHIANGGKRTRYERHLMVQQGVRRGVPDLCLPVPCRGFHGLYVEMKAAPPRSSSVSDEQDAWIRFLSDQGYRAAVARGALDAQRLILDYLSPHDQAH